jgi:molecular chaperone GrpE
MPSSPESETRSAPADQDPDQEQQPEEGRASELEELREQNARLEDRYKRALADLDNYRKRSARDLERRIDESREAVIRDWLDVVDSIDRALRIEPENPAAEGLRQVLEQMEGILAREGVQRTGRTGDRFDPERHEAVGIHHTDEVPDQTIADVARSGYTIGDRVLRPAEVIVARNDGSGE